MKILCTKENLSLALSLISGITSKNVNLPILNNVLIKVENQKVELITTNLELAITTQLRSQIEEEGSFTVPAKTLYDFVNLLSDEKVELSVKENELEVRCGKSATKIKGSTSEEFPVLPTVEEGDGFLLSSDEFKKGLDKVIQAAAKHDIRPELAGVLFDFNEYNEGQLTMAATDSYRLAEKKLKLNQGKEKKRLIVPARTAQEINRVLALVKNSESSEQSTRLVVTDNQIVVRCSDVELISRLVAGKYPDYTQIIPKEFKTTAILPVNKTVKEVKAASLFTTTGVNAVSLTVLPEKGMVGLSSASAQAGEHKSEIVSEIEGGENSILLNHRYVLDGLGNMEDEECELKIVNKDNPCLFKPKEDKSYLYIVMPIRQ